MPWIFWPAKSWQAGGGKLPELAELIKRRPERYCHGPCLVSHHKGALAALHRLAYSLSP